MIVIQRIGILGLIATPLALCQGPPVLTIQGIRGTSSLLTIADLASLPQQTVKTTDHGNAVTFQGVRLADVLSRVALPAGEKFHATAAAYYLMVQAHDGYRAVFAWAELDPSFMDKAAYVVTKRDCKPLPVKDGPFQLVVPGEKRNARWVRQMSLLRVEPLPTSPDFDSEQARWIAANLPELESIKPGMTRKELLRVFREEGGISTRLQRRYVYRRCGYVKVEVEFSAAGPPNQQGEGQDDLITKISKPFLEFAIMD